MADNQFGTGKILQNITQMKRELPPILANQARNFFLDSFDKQGWQDGTQQNWKEVQRRIPGTPEYKYPKKKQLSRRDSPILVRTGKLRRAVRNSIRTQTFEKVELIVPLKYADVHNSGDANHAKRQFMGDSKTLRDKQKKTISNRIDKAFQR